MDSRITDFKNEVVIDLLSNYSIEELRSLFLCVNSIRTKNKYLEEEEYYNDLQYKDDGVWIDEYLEYEVNIPLTLFKDYAIKKKKAEDDIVAIVSDIMDKKICYEYKTKRVFKHLIDTVEYDFEFKEFIIKFRKNTFSYIMNLEDNFFSIDLNELNQLKGKYEIGIYLLYWRWINTGKALMNVEEVRRYFGINNIDTPNYKVLQNMKLAINNINTKLDYNIKLQSNSQRRGSKVITDIKIYFIPQTSKRKQLEKVV